MSRSTFSDPIARRSIAQVSPSIAMKLAVRASKGDEAIAVGNRAGLIEWTNAAWTRITGWALERCVDKPVTRLLDEVGVDAEVLDFVSQNYLAGRHCAVELPIGTPEGSTRWIHLEVDPCRDEHGEISDFVAVARDISALRRAERALEAPLDEAEGAGRLRPAPGPAAREAGRELPEPGIAALAVEAILTAGTLAPLAERLGELAGEAGRLEPELSGLAERLGRAVARLSARATESAPSPCAVDVSLLVQRCCQTLAKTLHPQLQLDPALPEALPLIAAPAARLADVLIDLLQAAAARIGDGWGTLSLTTGRTEPGQPLLSEVFHRGYAGTLHDEGVRVFIELHDTGQALTPEQCARLRRGLLPAPRDAATLALLCAREQISALGGELHVSSVIGAGTRLLLLFPALEAGLA